MSARKASKAQSRSKRRSASSGPRASSTTKPLVARQPQSKQQAAVKSGMFLYTNDAWSLRCFDSGDLHCVDRALFG